MYTTVIILIFIVCILLALAVLIQNSKGGGLAAGFSSSQQVMGVRKTTDFLEKFTWGLAIALFTLSLTGNFVLPKNETKQVKASSIQEQIDNATVPAANSPVMPPSGKGNNAPAPAPKK